jgi:Xaa-Pro dipeptidase
MADLASLYPAHLKTVMERHDRALPAMGYDAIVIAAGEPHYAFLDDNTYPFRPNPHFKSWVPVTTNPHCFIVYKPGSKPVLVYWQPVDYWYKPADTPSGYWVDSFDIRIAATPEDARKYFPKSGRVAFIGEPMTEPFGDVNPQALLEQLHFERSWKTDYEIECMRQANVKGARGHRAAEKAFRSGATEYQIHLEFLRASDQTEEEIPYFNIIALNEHASVLHYTLHERSNGARHSFLIDAGAAINGYASDITRTYSQNDDEFGQLIKAMDRAQQEMCAAVKPHTNYPDLHMFAHRKTADILLEFGFARDIDAAGLVDKRITTTFFPHGVGHFIGLQVHDVAGFHADASGRHIPKPEGHPYLRLTRKIEPRFVFTVEPGFYFIEPLLADLKKSDNAKYINWSKVDSFRKFGGVRIEDDVVVTETGHENLTRDAFAKV